MALIKRLLLIKYSETVVTMTGKKEPEKALLVEHFYYQEKDKKIFTQNAVDFVLYNIGTAKVFLWDNLVVLPGASFSLPKSNSLPLANDISITYEGDYAITRNIADVVVPPSA